MKILSIDGGGVRGIFPARILFRIQEDLGINIEQYFDLFAGTSAGGIVASIIADGHGTEAAEKFFSDDTAIIEKSKKPFSFGFVSSSYSNAPLRNLLRGLFRNKVCTDIKKNLLVAATDIIRANPVIFSSYTKKEGTAEFNKIDVRKITVVEALLASTAAPILFKPVKVGRDILADGGLWANNPAMIALTEAQKIFATPLKNIKMFSIGTGYLKKLFNEEDISKYWGLYQWGYKLLDIFFTAPQKSVDLQSKMLLSEGSYMRINFESKTYLSIIDAGIIPKIKTIADVTFNKNKEKIREFFEG